MIEARDWLPKNSLLSGGVSEKLLRSVSAWSERWFGNSQFVQTEIQTILSRAAPALGSAEWRCFEPGIEIGRAGDTDWTISSMALDATNEVQPIGETDRQLVAAFAERMSKDLASTLSVALGRATGQGLHKNLKIGVPEIAELRLNLQSEDYVVVVHIDASRLVPLRKRLCPPLIQSPVHYVSWLKALSDTPVRFEARLGIAHMSAGDLAGMAPDDVVVFETALTVPLKLMSANKGQPLCAAVLGRQGDELAIIAAEFGE